VRTLGPSLVVGQPKSKSHTNLILSCP
jgi:hypothetical protein